MSYSREQLELVHGPLIGSKPCGPYNRDLTGFIRGQLENHPAKHRNDSRHTKKLVSPDGSLETVLSYQDDSCYMGINRVDDSDSKHDGRHYTEVVRMWLKLNPGIKMFTCEEENGRLFDYYGIRKSDFFITREEPKALSLKERLEEGYVEVFYNTDNFWDVYTYDPDIIVVSGGEKIGKNRLLDLSTIFKDYSTEDLRFMSFSLSEFLEPHAEEYYASSSIDFLTRDDISDYVFIRCMHRENAGELTLSELFENK